MHYFIHWNTFCMLNLLWGLVKIVEIVVCPKKYKNSIQNVSNISTKQKKEKKTSPKEVEQKYE